MSRPTKKARERYQRRQREQELLALAALSTPHPVPTHGRADAATTRIIPVVVVCRKCSKPVGYVQTDRATGQVLVWCAEPLDTVAPVALRGAPTVDGRCDAHGPHTVEVGELLTEVAIAWAEPVQQRIVRV